MNFNYKTFWWTFKEWQIFMWPHIYSTGYSCYENEFWIEFLESDHRYWFWESLNNYGGVLDIDEDNDAYYYENEGR